MSFFGKDSLVMSPQGSNFKILIFSWNMGNEAPKGLEEVFHEALSDKNYELLAIGMQESTYSIKQQRGDSIEDCKKHLFNCLEAAVGKRYYLVERCQRAQLQMFLFAAKELRNRISHVNKSIENTGFLHVFPNKGGLLVTVHIDGTKLAFVSCHLTAHEGARHCEERNNSIIEILGGVRAGDTRFDIAEQFHHIFWMGDMNYRITYDPRVPGTTKKNKSSHAEATNNNNNIYNNSSNSSSNSSSNYNMNNSINNSSQRGGGGGGFAVAEGAQARNGGLSVVSVQLPPSPAERGIDAAAGAPASHSFGSEGGGGGGAVVVLSGPGQSGVNGSGSGAEALAVGEEDEEELSDFEYDPTDNADKRKQKKEERRRNLRKTFDLIVKEAWPELLMLDELNRELKAGRVLNGFTALQPSFPPTFKRTRGMKIEKVTSDAAMDVDASGHINNNNNGSGGSGSGGSSNIKKGYCIKKAATNTRRQQKQLPSLDRSSNSSHNSSTHISTQNSTSPTHTIATHPPATHLPSPTPSHTLTNPAASLSAAGSSSAPHLLLHSNHPASSSTGKSGEEGILSAGGKGKNPGTGPAGKGTRTGTGTGMTSPEQVDISLLQRLTSRTIVDLHGGGLGQQQQQQQQDHQLDSKDECSVEDYYNMLRMPSFTDRILYKSLPAFAERLAPLMFDSCEQATSSDHKPVIAGFEVQPTYGEEEIMVDRSIFFSRATSKRSSAPTITTATTTAAAAATATATASAASSAQSSAAISSGGIVTTLKLAVSNLRGENLEEMDSALFGGKSDPYIVINTDPGALLLYNKNNNNNSNNSTPGDVRIYPHGGEGVRSSVIKRTINPIWNETMLLTLSSIDLDALSHTASLIFSVWDEDTYNADDLIGVFTIPLRRVIENNGRLDFKDDLKSRSEIMGKLSGTITVLSDLQELRRSFRDPIVVEHLVPLRRAVVEANHAMIGCCTVT